MTHEDLVKAQTMFLQALGELSVVEQDIARLKKLPKGLAPSKLRDRLYEQQKLQVVLCAPVKAMTSPGNSEPSLAMTTQD